MTLRAPQPQMKPRDGALNYEIAQEKAAALGRLGRALEAARAALADHDRTAGTKAASSAARERLLRQAGYALWCFVVQREACGLRDQRLIVRDYGVPREVQNRMGVVGNSGRPAQA
jgi:hypothetical protein